MKSIKHTTGLCVCVRSFFVHACVFMSASVHVFFSDYCFNPHLFSFQNIHSVFPLRCTYPFIAFTLSCPHILYFLSAPHLNLFSKPSHLQVLEHQLKGLKPHALSHLQYEGSSLVSNIALKSQEKFKSL